MAFSVRVHPTLFSPTPNRHPGIKLKINGGGSGAGGFKLAGALEPRNENTESPLPGQFCTPPTTGLFFFFSIAVDFAENGPILYLPSGY